LPKVNANNIEIHYETFGDPSAKPLLLIMGFGSQLIHWDEEFCEMLAKRGHYVIRYDNRDVGLSTKIDEAGTPDFLKAISSFQKGEKVQAPYTMDDMADDAVGLLDALKISSAHICGCSMGGVIAQYIAINHPSRVLSLTSMMSTTGNPDLPPLNPEAMKLFLLPVPSKRDAYIKDYVKREKVMYGPIIPLDEERRRLYAAKAYDRCFYPQGNTRQIMALLTSGNRKPALASVKIPTLVIHGGNDPLVSLEAGKDTAEAIPGAELLIIDGMGHSLPPETWSQVVDGISRNTTKAQN
jgi:pimeloyl-ACP methyl ester carboxylesterase